MMSESLDMGTLAKMIVFNMPSADVKILNAITGE